MAGPGGIGLVEAWARKFRRLGDQMEFLAEAPLRESGWMRCWPQQPWRMI